MYELQPYPIRQETFIALPIEKVFATITSAAGWDAFFTSGMTLDPRPGGKMIWRWKDWGPNFYTLEADGDVLALEPPHRFVFRWYPVDRNHPTTIDMNLAARHGGTVISLSESGYPDSLEGKKMILECAAGWGEAMTLLKFYLEHGVTYTPPKR